MSDHTTYYSNGKLLLTGEYVVLDGATALAIPTKYGQSLSVTPTTSGHLHWISKDCEGAIWFSTTIDLDILTALAPCKISATLCNILQTARKHNSSFLRNCSGLAVTTQLDFPRDWGLGTSSTLINNIAQWAKIDAFTLLNESFGGSGYDIAAGQNNSPIFYSIKNKKPFIQACELPWDFVENLFFVHLNQKQDSKQGISAYRSKKKDLHLIETISDYSKKLLLCYTRHEFEKLMDAHEQKIAKHLGQPTIKERLFNDYTNSIKSLGAWGGDFILVTGDHSDIAYFRNKGYHTVIPFPKMML